MLWIDRVRTNPFLRRLKHADGTTEDVEISEIDSNITTTGTPLDSNNLNKIVSGATQYGGTIISASEDLNNITKSGFYTCYGTTTNAPSTSYSWFIIHENSNAGVVTAVQTAKAYSTSLVISYRLKIGSTWGSWIDPNKTIINLIYPVGSIYMSVNSISPSDLFGGTWTQINGRFLYCSTTSKTTGGNTTTGSTALTIEQIPSHNHAVKNLMPVNFNVGTEGYDTDGKATAYLNTSDYFKTSFVGGGQGHTHPQNLPPFFTVYCWYRIA